MKTRILAYFMLCHGKLISIRSEVFCKKDDLKKFLKIHRKTPVQECLF